MDSIVRLHNFHDGYYTSMILYSLEARKIDFGSGSTKQRMLRYFITKDERDTYHDFVKKVWDVLRKDQLTVEIPELERDAD